MLMNDVAIIQSDHWLYFTLHKLLRGNIAPQSLCSYNEHPAL